MRKPCNSHRIITLFLLLTICLILSKNYKNMEAYFHRILSSELQFNTVNRTCTEPINIMFVMTSLEDTKEFPVQLKSILYHRTSPLFLHVFVTDDVINLVMTTLLDTWQADQVFYKIYQVLPETVSTDHLIGVLALLKHLPPFLTEIVYLDSKIFLLHDVRMWLQIAANSIPSYKFFLSDHSGCATTQKQAKCNTTHSLLYINFKKIDILNIEALINTLDYRMGTLPCILTPMSISSMNDFSNRCFKYFKNTKPVNLFVAEKDVFLSIKHFPDQFSVSVKESIATISSIEPMTKIWWQFSGNACSLCKEVNESLFKNMSMFSRKSEVYSSSLLSLSDGTDEIGVCAEFLQIAYLKRRTLLFFHCGINYKTVIDTDISGDPEVTLVTSLTLDRFTSLEKMLLYWTGPAAILFYITDYEATYQLPQLLKSSTVLRRSELLDRIAIHVVYKRTHYVPINYLRNILLNHTLTSHYFYVDADFVPNFNIYNSIIAHLKKTANGSNKVWVVPAFQTFVNLEYDFPQNKAQLLELFEHGILSVFQEKVFPKGHAPTNYSVWINSTEPYQVDFDEKYEPYVIASRCMAVIFNENLLERMSDKISYVRLLYSLGYDFYVLPYDFVIHLPHSIGHITQQFNKAGTARSCKEIFYSKYEKKLEQMFPNRLLSTYRS